MPDQLEIPWPPATHAGDPPSSHYAEDRVTRSGKRRRQAEQVLAILREHTRDGARVVPMTGAELAQASGMDRIAIQRRLKELVDAGLAHGSHPQTRPCRVLGSRCVEWWV